MKNRPKGTMVVGEVNNRFSRIIADEAAKTGNTFLEQLVYWAIIGADCQRTHFGRVAHIKTRQGRIK